MKRRIRFFLDTIRKNPVLVSVAILFAVYVTRLPFTVQTGDTGELVANAFRLQVSHPPGYPLYTWLYALFTHALPVGSVFFRASLLTALIASSALYVVAVGNVNRFMVAAVVLSVGLSRLIWQYAELPDVFALNCLCAAGLVAIVDARTVSINKKCLIAGAIFAAGAANHLTIVFLLPLVAVLFWQAELRARLTALCVFAATVLIFYGSMLSFHPNAFFSWGHLQSPADILSHFLREDYAAYQPKSLQPAASHIMTAGVGERFSAQFNAWLGMLLNEPGSHGFNSWMFNFFVTLFVEVPAISALIVVYIWLAAVTGTLSKKSIAIILAIGFNVYFFAAILRIPFTPYGTLVAERFFILPIFLAAALAISLLSDVGQKFPLLARVTGCLLVMSAVLNFLRLQTENDFSRNTIIEDYAVNFLRINASQEGKRSVVLTANDTSYFAMRYAQTVLQITPETVVLYPNLLFHGWYRDKLKAAAPEFQFRLPNSEEKRFSLEDDLLKPNLKAFNFFFETDFTNDQDFRLQFKDLGRQASLGRGREFNLNEPSNLQLRSNPDYLARPSGRFDEYRYFYSLYSHGFLARGLAAYADGQSERAKADFKAALALVPYCIPALENLCSLRKTADPRADSTELESQTDLVCSHSLEWLKSKHFDYFKGP